MRNLLCVSASGDGWTNLGRDEWFLEHISDGEMMLFFYVNNSAVIIGRNQNPWAECNLEAMERDGVQLVRRITGGGAVFHDAGNLNFSFIAAADRYDQNRQLRLILGAVQALGIPCEFTGRNDLVADGHKFSGNAYCMRSKVKQHHGTLLVSADLDRLQRYLRVDPRKLHSKGTASVRSRVCNLAQFCPGLTTNLVLEALKDAYAREYGAFEEIAEGDLPAREIEPYVQKHASWAWRLGETPQFDLEVENRFCWGSVQLLFTLKHTQVADVRVFSDALDADLAQDVRQLLLGRRFGSEPLARALEESAKPQVRELAMFLRDQGL